jgi:BirA family biotin operon repressor/biotin-[acetyl-CoA-carboxylase] ligase
MSSIRILKILLQAHDYVSGQLMCDQLKITRSAVWKNIHHLRKQGYDIHASTNRGYKIIKFPDKISVTDLKRQLTTQFIGQKFYYFDQLPSTMDEALSMAHRLKNQGAVVCAGQQTKGRGRLGRVWDSSGNGLYFSIVLYPSLTLEQLPNITLMAAISIRRAVKKLTGLELKVKWPNDLTIHDKKVAGILTETRLEASQIRLVVVGIGINVNQTPASVKDIATSLKEQIQQEMNHSQLLAGVLNEFERCYKKLESGEFEPILSEAKKNSATLNRLVKICVGKEEVQGKAYDLDEDGALLIKLTNGKIRRIVAGELAYVG